jgi:hypothetical protein
MKDTSTMLEAFIRLSCEVGYPKYVMCDQEGSILAAMKKVKVELRDLSHRLYSEHGVLLEVCPVGGHDQHGKVERTVKSVQDGLEDIGLSKMRLHAMGIQTLCKQVENAYNNLPLGFRYDRAQDNTQNLKLVPNMLRIGRINSRALDGPVKLSAASAVANLTVRSQSTTATAQELFNTPSPQSIVIRKSLGNLALPMHSMMEA